jgi:hypothetical protein
MGLAGILSVDELSEAARSDFSLLRGGTDTERQINLANAISSQRRATEIFIKALVLNRLLVSNVLIARAVMDP